MKFVIITPTYNSEDWIGRCIQSVKAQTHENYLHIVINDGSTDNTHDEIVKNLHDKLLIITHDTRLGTMVSHIDGHNYQYYDISPEDIIAHLDGDDWLANNIVLDTVADVYDTHDCLVTYGNFITTDGSPSCCRLCTIPPREALKSGWPFSHLRTFKRKLWNPIPDSYFRDSNNKYFTSATDTAIMASVIEQAKDNVCFIDQELYIYNRHNPLSEDKTDLADQQRCATIIANKTPLPCLKK